jgi:hypothetical protein
VRWFAALALIACSAKPADDVPLPAAIDGAIARAGAFLALQQDDDGAIRSHRYAALKEGWSLTPLAAMALRVIPDQRAAYGRAVDHVAQLTPETPGVSYPIYAYAIGALVLGAPENLAAHAPRRDALLGALRGLQRADGGWGYDPQASNLSATVIAVGALALAGTPPTDPALARARGFVARCQNPDGGFFFSPDNADGNKAGPADGGGFRSYGSMTADGVRALVRLGVGAGDPAVVAGARWLAVHFDPAENPGDFVRINEIRRASSYYYWAWSAAHARTHVAPGDKAWAEALARELLRRQARDGSWQNSASEMREDDPVIATAYAVAALALCKGVVTGEHPSHASWK